MSLSDLDLHDLGYLVDGELWGLTIRTSIIEDDASAIMAVFTREQAQEIARRIIACYGPATPDR